MYIVGIDGGGTKTVGILTTGTGRHLAQVQSGPANYHVVGEAKTQAVLEDLIGELYAKAGVHDHQEVLSVGILTTGTGRHRFCLGMAGVWDAP